MVVEVMDALADWSMIAPPMLSDVHLIIVEEEMVRVPSQIPIAPPPDE